MGKCDKLAKLKFNSKKFFQFVWKIGNLMTFKLAISNKNVKYVGFIFQKLWPMATPQFELWRQIVPVFLAIIQNLLEKTNFSISYGNFWSVWFLVRVIHGHNVWIFFHTFSYMSNASSYGWSKYSIFFFIALCTRVGNFGMVVGEI